MGEHADEAIEQIIWGSSGYITQHFNCKSSKDSTQPGKVQLAAMTAQGDRKVEESKDGPGVVNTKAVCPFCQANGLHWSRERGYNRLRNEHGIIHDCGRSKITINIPGLIGGAE